MSQFSSEEFQKLLSPPVLTIKEVFQKHNYELRLCGGAVRDLLQGKEPKDIDFATTALPEQMLALCSEHNWRTINANGLSHGTVTVRLDDINFEITTLRIDKVTDGRRAAVEFTTDWKLDAERRDLTFNSLFLGLDGTLYDYFDGEKDLHAKRVRFVGDADKRIQEDYLRILRYFRFFGVVDADADSHDAETLECIKANAKGLERISGERIWTELKKIVSGKNGPHLMEKMFELDLFQFYGLPADRNPTPEFEAVYNRCKSFSPLPITLLSSLFLTEPEVLAFDKRIKLSRLERQIPNLQTIIEKNNRPIDLSEFPRPRKRLIEFCQQFESDDVSNSSESGKKLVLLFGKKPQEMVMQENSLDVKGVRFEDTSCPGEAAKVRTIDADLVIKSIGYQHPVAIDPLLDKYLDRDNSCFLHRNGKMDDGLFCSGWAKTGPVGVIASTLNDANETAKTILDELESSSCNGSEKEDIESYLEKCSLPYINKNQWQKLFNKEVELGKSVGKPRLKFESILSQLNVMN